MLRDTNNKLHRELSNVRRRRLVYDGITLIPFDDGTGLSDRWHLPGGEIASTDKLFRRARSRNVNVLLIE